MRSSNFHCKISNSNLSFFMLLCFCPFSYLFKHEISTLITIGHSHSLQRKKVKIGRSFNIKTPLFSLVVQNVQNQPSELVLELNRVNLSNLFNFVEWKVDLWPGKAISCEEKNLWTTLNSLSCDTAMRFVTYKFTWNFAFLSADCFTYLLIPPPHLMPSLIHVWLNLQQFVPFYGIIWSKRYFAYRTLNISKLSRATTAQA